MNTNKIEEEIGHSGECSEFGCADNCERHKYVTTFSMAEMGVVLAEIAGALLGMMLFIVICDYLINKFCDLIGL